MHNPSQTHNVVRPSNDVIETFKRVFIKSMHRTDRDVDANRAEQIVNAAIRRVLEPHAMEGVAPHPEEDDVAKAFWGVVNQPSGPRGQQQQSQRPPVTATTNVVATAAMSAAATAGAQGRPLEVVKVEMGGGNSKSPSQPPPAFPVVTTPTPSTSITTAPPTTMTKSPQVQRPAEANLIGMLMGSGSGSSTSPAPPPSSTNPAVKTQAAQINGRANGTSTPSRPDVEPLTPPAISTSPKMGTKRAASVELAEGDEKRAKTDVESANSEKEGEK